MSPVPGQVVLITDASCGIGAAVARKLAGEGATLAVPKADRVALAYIESQKAAER